MSKCCCEVSTRRDFDIVEVERGGVREDVEVIEVSCCPVIRCQSMSAMSHHPLHTALSRISSTGLLSRLYPGVAGLYSKVEVRGAPGRGSGPVRRLQVYRKASTGGTQFYISRPEAAIGVDKEHAS